MITARRLSAALPLVLLLAACGGSEDAAPERKSAAGEVLGGSISDAMLPLDTATSRSPALREEPATGASGEAGDTAEAGSTRRPAPAPSAAATAAATAGEDQPEG